MQWHMARGTHANDMLRKLDPLVLRRGTEVATSYFQKDLLIFFKTKELRRHGAVVAGTCSWPCRTSRISNPAKKHPFTNEKP
ncbi:hypothetical protein L6164_028101 [Bauhinia variegata]|uniref:Uncharacterized protein n=1 Tax=Bauhinia variegata TaxID=167791 RepID=A0ACB9LUU1_BAUVA|nr:hypothetical protein L6164_028101 [Bauhinia variegata]